ncbi:PilZ domain-containing protein [Marinomonas fungiae]|uniref:PilZ domain n=1 Tax=Marinomonas fungiae TaxID=1137284 RepID=A0A0K6IJ79_9GAMM|nr:PilZ domain-containing protein [Marinomonas fungiae]CUB03402.1 PilZ domain [Marinomonas fungiae]
MSEDANFDYHSNERRNAVRVIPVGHKLSFNQGELKLGCLDISMDGVALKSNASLPTSLDEQVGFILDQDDRVIGKIKARLIYKLEQRSGWQFTAMEDKVREFIETLVLATQKQALRKAANERLIEQEKELLHLDLDSEAQHED